MDVQVKHNGTDITGHVISYNREHKICTGIGMIELDVEYTYSTSFDPWDTIAIYENGDHVATYYVSSASESQPNSVISVTAQDKSKRLSDYFITDSYLIDYPSYSRYWIETFLTEVGISYTFLTDSQGNLLSNNTALGLMTAYEQVISLLQMSGWYITFNAGGKAIIGKLDTDKAKSGGSLGTHDITEIKAEKSDRMYRNRVVVWGHGDPASSRWVFADVRKPTKWDYDKKDLRTILISNSNIPTVKDAFMLANQALTEFARLNVEKFITATGARDMSIGDVISVRTKVFTGKGLITTFGVSMSRSGLLTNIALDERCPRLFGFYNPGGYVYVGTFGSGVWRKHILDYSHGVPSGVVLSGLATNVYSGTWFNYSSGLKELEVTDLHINNGVLSSVTSAGTMYYSLEDITPWSGVAMSGLQVSISGIILDPTVYSGLKARACIVDRDTNNVRFAVDNYSGMNYGDFLMETENSSTLNGGFQYTVSGFIIGSGIWGASGGRGWVLDVNPYDGAIENTYPISVSGDYNIFVYDIENDGTNDYVEVLSQGSGVMPQYYINSNIINTFHGNTYFDQIEYDPGLIVSMPYSGYPTPIKQIPQFKVQGNAGIDSVFALYDNIPAGNAYGAWAEAALHTVTANIWILSINGLGNLVESNITKSISISNAVSLYIDRVDPVVFRFFLKVASAIKRYDYNSSSNTISAQMSVGTLPSSSNSYLVRGAIVYQAELVNATYGFELKLHTFNLNTGATTTRSALLKEGTGVSTGQHLYRGQHVRLVAHGESSVTVYCPYMKVTWLSNGVPNASYEARVYRYLEVDWGSGNDTLVHDWYASHGASTVDTFSNYSTNVKDSTDIVGNEPDYGNFNADRTYYVYSVSHQTNGSKSDTLYDYADNVVIEPYSSTPEIATYLKIYNLLGRTDISIGFSQVDDFYIINPRDGSRISKIPVPFGWHLHDYAGYDTYNREFYFRVSTSPSSMLGGELVSISTDGTITRRSSIFSASLDTLYMVGSFRYSAQIRPIFYYAKPQTIYGKFPQYMVLQRDGYDFNVVKSGMTQDRLDISIYSPLVTMGRQIDSLETYFFSTDSSVTQTTHNSISGYNLGMSGLSGSISGLMVLGDDFRYSDFEDTVESGTSRRLFIVYSGGVGSADIWTLDSFSGEFVSPSGIAKRVELSNFSLPDQYVFTAVSGYAGAGGEWGFFQKSPSYSGYTMSSGLFVDYSSGYPQARTTIIRLDDSI